MSGRVSDRRKITLERTYDAALSDVWELWTTKEGIESWWGPGGFSVTVHSIDLRPGGELHYAMTATAPPQVQFMRDAGMPLTTECRITYAEVAPKTRLAYIHVADFIPGIQPYDVAHAIDLYEVHGGVRLVLTIDAMHDEEWTQRAIAGWGEELEKLAAALAHGQALEGRAVSDA